MKINCIIGIDPGASGGLAVWRPQQTTRVIKMPKDILELRFFLDDMKSVCNPIIFLEKVQMHHGDFDVPGKAFGIKKMLDGFQQLKDVLTLSEIPFVLVHPKKWQSDLHLTVKGEEKAERKKRYQRHAAQHYPEVRVSLWNADALLLVHFGRFKLKHYPEWVLENLPKPLHDKLF